MNDQNTRALLRALHRTAGDHIQRGYPRPDAYRRALADAISLLDAAATEQIDLVERYVACAPLFALPTEETQQ